MEVVFKIEEGGGRSEGQNLCCCSSVNKNFPLLRKSWRCWTELAVQGFSTSGFVLAQFQIALSESKWLLPPLCVGRSSVNTMNKVKVCLTWGSTAVQVTALGVNWGQGGKWSDFSREPVRRRQSVMRRLINRAPSISQDRKGRNSHNCEHHTPSKDPRLFTTCSTYPSFCLRKTVSLGPKKKRSIE